MKPKTADTLVRTLQVLTQYMQGYWLKITAMERVLRSHPEMQEEYQREMDNMQKDPSIGINHLESDKILEELRTELIQDQE